VVYAVWWSRGFLFECGTLMMEPRGAPCSSCAGVNIEPWAGPEHPGRPGPARIRFAKVVPAA